MPERPPDRTRRATVAFVAAAALAAAAYVALTAWSAPTFRGSDQYWYVEDTEALATDQPAITHEVFPYFLSVPRDEYWNEPPFIHNVPVLRVWAAAARVLPVAEPFDAMLLVNVLCALLGALFAGLATARFTGRWTALGAAAAYLFIPVGFWVTGQGMSEPFSGMLVALALWLVVRWPGRMWPLLAAQAAVALAAAGRIWCLPYLALLPLSALIAEAEAPRARRWLTAGGALAGGGVAYWLLSRAFVNYMPPLDPMVLLEVSRTNNMVMYYRIEPAPAFDLGVFVRELGRNAVAALKVQFHPGTRVFDITRFAPWADRWPVNALAVFSACGLVWRGMGRERRFVLALGVAAWLVHVGMAVIYLNQPRYVVAVLPPLVVGAAVGFDSLLRMLPAAVPARRTWTAALVGAALAALAAAVAIDAGNAVHYRADALAQAARRAEARSAIGPLVPLNADVVLDTAFDARWVADYAVSPRRVLALTTTFPYDDATYRRLLERFSADHLVADSTSRLPALLGATRLGGTDSLTVYRIPPR